MKKTPFVWLGANRARKWPVGEKARLLDKAAHAGLPVPAGAILMDELFQVFRDEGVVSTAVPHGAVTDFDADWLYESLYEGIRFPRLDKPVILRPAFTPVPQPVASAARTHVDMNDPDELARALCSVWSVPSPSEIAFRRDVLVMEMVSAAVVQGTAVTTKNNPIDHTTTQTASHDLPQLTGFFPRTDSSLPPYAQRLQKLLSGIRRTFGKGVWQVDWLDDGEICWVCKVVELQSGKGAG